MNHIYLCPKHYNNQYFEIETKDGDCKFCLQEKVVDWKKEMEEDRDKFI